MHSDVIYMGIIVPVSVIIPISVAIPKYTYGGQAMKIIFYFLLLDGAINLLSVILGLFNIHNLWLLHVDTVLEFLLLAWFYQQVLRETIVRKVIKYLMFIFPVLCVLNFLFLQNINHFNTNTKPAEALIIMACSLAFFAQTTDVENNIKWGANPLNWVNTGILLYFSGALFIFSFSNIAATHMATATRMSPQFYDLNILIWNIHATLLLAMYVLFSIGFSKCRKL